MLQWPIIPTFRGHEKMFQSLGTFQSVFQWFSCKQDGWVIYPMPSMTPCSSKTHLAFHSIGLHHELRCHQFLFSKKKGNTPLVMRQAPCRRGSFRHFRTQKVWHFCWADTDTNVFMSSQTRKGHFTQQHRKRQKKSRATVKAKRAKSHLPDLPFVLWHNSIRHPIAFASNSPPVVHHKPLDLQWP